jgi:hypothetical protein
MGVCPASDAARGAAAACVPPPTSSRSVSVLKPVARVLVDAPSAHRVIRTGGATEARHDAAQRVPGPARGPEAFDARCRVLGPARPASGSARLAAPPSASASRRSYRVCAAALSRCPAVTRIVLSKGAPRAGAAHPLRAAAAEALPGLRLAGVAPRAHRAAGEAALGRPARSPRPCASSARGRAGRSLRRCVVRSPSGRPARMRWPSRRCWRCPGPRCRTRCRGPASRSASAARPAP